MRELLDRQRWSLASPVDAARDTIRRPGTLEDDERLVGLLMIRDEDDVLEEMLRTATQWFDRILVLDGTTDAHRVSATTSILESFPEVVHVLKDADVSAAAIRDGARQFLLDEARRRYGTNQWIGLLHADEFIDQDPRPLLNAHHPMLDPVLRVRLVHAFLHTDNEAQWSADPAAWNSQPLRERVDHVMWPGVPEARFFFDRGTRDYVVEHHSKTVPTSFRAGPIEHGFSIVQYNERSPEQVVARSDSRRDSGWQTEHYARFGHDEPVTFTPSLDLPESPFAPEFSGDPDGPFRAALLSDVPAGPFPEPLPGREELADDLRALVDLPSTGRSIEWKHDACASLPRRYHSLVDYTARVISCGRNTSDQRLRAAAEFTARLRHLTNVDVERKR